MKRSDITAAAILGVSSLLVGLVLVEVLLRLSNSAAEVTNTRFLFITPASFRNEAPLVPAYVPQAEVRQVAIFRIQVGRGVEFVPQYDVRYRSNNQGHIQARDTFCGRETVAVFGDSFTEGQGAKPWFYGLENAVTQPAPQIVNFGIMGTGVGHWAIAFDHYKKCYDIKKLVVVFISDDWYRSVWNFDRQQLACLNEVGPCRETEVLYSSMKPEQDIVSLIRAAKLRDGEREQQYFWRTRLRTVNVVSKAAQVIDEKLVPLSDKQKDRRDHYLTAQQAFGSMAANFDRDSVRLVNVTMVEETSGAPNPETQEVLEWLGKQGYNVSRCPLSRDEFLRYDGHPNETGYKRLRGCVQDAIEAATGRTIFTKTSTHASSQ